MAESHPASNGKTDPERSALNAQIMECESTLAWLRDPRGASARAKWQQILNDYEQVLHNVNAEPSVLKNAAFAVDIAKKCLNLELFYVQRLGAAKSALARHEDHGPTASSERTLTFMR